MGQYEIHRACNPVRVSRIMEACLNAQAKITISLQSRAGLSSKPLAKSWTALHWTIPMQGRVPQPFRGAKRADEVAALRGLNA